MCRLSFDKCKIILLVFTIIIMLSSCKNTSSDVNTELYDYYKKNIISYSVNTNILSEYEISKNEFGSIRLSYYKYPYYELYYTYRVTDIENPYNDINYEIIDDLVTIMSKKRINIKTIKSAIEDDRKFYSDDLYSINEDDYDGHLMYKYYCHPVTGNPRIKFDIQNIDGDYWGTVIIEGKQKKCITY